MLCPFFPSPIYGKEINKYTQHWFTVCADSMLFLLHLKMVTVRMGKAAKVQASRKQLETAGFVWPPSETQSTSTVVPTTACGLPAPLSGRQLEWWFKDE
jgi:hypothetical protein